MSHQVPYTYPLAPIEVTTANGREMLFEVDRSGKVEITVEVDDPSTWSAPRTMEVGFWLSAEDWRAVVAHVERDLPSGNGDRPGSPPDDTLITQITPANDQEDR